MGRIFCKFCKLAFIHKTNFQWRLFQCNMICMFMQFIHPVHKMALYKYFKKSFSALPNPNSSLSGCMRSEAFFCHEMSRLFHQDTGQKSNKITSTTPGGYFSLSTTKSLLLHKLILICALGSMCWIRSIRLIMGAWVLWHLSLPLLLRTGFTKSNCD